MVRAFLAVAFLPHLLLTRSPAVLAYSDDISSYAHRSSGAQHAILTTTNAAWMSGRWGVGFRFPGGRFMEENRRCGNRTYPVEPLLDQLTSNYTAGTGPSWIIAGLSRGAAGDSYNSIHPVLTGLDDTNGTLYTPSRNGNSDHFETILRYVKKNSDLKVIAYLATEGPAKTKHGYTRAYDYVEGKAYVRCPKVQRKNPGRCTAAMRVWIDAVHGWYGTTDDSDPAAIVAALHLAFAEKIVRPYVQKFAGRVDGYWFDHAEHSDVDLLDTVIGEEDPKAAISFNMGRNVPLAVNSPGREDYTSGHPIPLRQGAPGRQENEILVTSIEGTLDGYIRKKTPDDWVHEYRRTTEDSDLAKRLEAGRRSEKKALPSLGHLFMPSSDTSWNGIGARVGWKDPMARMWLGRVLEAGGTWTWNVPRRRNNGCVDSAILDHQHVAFMQRVADITELRRCIGEAKRETSKKEHMQNLVKEGKRNCRKLPKAIRRECHKSNKQIYKTMLAKVFTKGTCENISDAEDREKCEEEKIKIHIELTNKAYRARLSDCARYEQTLWNEGRDDRLSARSELNHMRDARWRKYRDTKLRARLEWRTSSN